MDDPRTSPHQHDLGSPGGLWWTRMDPGEFVDSGGLWWTNGLWWTLVDWWTIVEIGGLWQTLVGPCGWWALMDDGGPWWIQAFYQAPQVHQSPPECTIPFESTKVHQCLLESFTPAGCTTVSNGARVHQSTGFAPEFIKTTSPRVHQSTGARVHQSTGVQWCTRPPGVS